jgi:hypothetical protein
MVAVPVWETQVQREKESELIFRGLQYVEAIRIFQEKNPGLLPQRLDELQEEKCIRKLFKDPMTEHGEWNLILQPDQPERSSGTGERPGSFRRTAGQIRRQQSGGEQPAESLSKVWVAPQSMLDSLSNPQIIGVVSASTRHSKKIYHEQDRYDKWLFFFGMDPKNMPEVEYLGKDGDGGNESPIS